MRASNLPSHRRSELENQISADRSDFTESHSSTPQGGKARFDPETTISSPAVVSLVLDCGRGAEAPRFHTKSSLAQARCSTVTWKALPKLEHPTVRSDRSSALKCRAVRRVGTKRCDGPRTVTSPWQITGEVERRIWEGRTPLCSVRPALYRN